MRLHFHLRRHATEGQVEVNPQSWFRLKYEAHDAAQTARIAWHIGNRHTPLQVLKGGGLRIRFDAILVAMVEGLGAHVHAVTAPFAPESGAYAPQAGHHHEQHGRHDHEH